MTQARTVREDDGSELDAHFLVEAVYVGGSHAGRAFDVVFMARYGTRNGPRALNVDYFPALEAILARLAVLGAKISDVWVDSRVARQLPAEQRRLDLPYPLSPRTNDVRELRLAMTRSQRSVAQRPGAKGGNNHKRIRIRVPGGDLPHYAPDLERMLASGVPIT